MAAQATMGSSALATTTVPAPSGPVPDRIAARAERHRSTSIRTSEIRSSWSLDRFNSTTTLGAVSSIRRPRYPSSTSSTAAPPAGAPASAATCPAGMLAPVTLETTSGEAGPESAATSIRVVVVFPLVPVTKATEWLPGQRGQE